MAIITHNENIPTSVQNLIMDFGFNDVHTVRGENITEINDSSLRDTCMQEKRILITLDNDFANRVLHPPEKIYGVILIS